MSHPYHHAVSSSKRWGGTPEEYQAIHDWFDETKAHFADPRHRAMRHHSEGIFLAEKIFGTTITLNSGKQVPVRIIGEQHVMEDLGWIPTMSDWLRSLNPEPWMNRVPGEKGFQEAPIAKPVQMKKHLNTKTTIRLS